MKIGVALPHMGQETAPALITRMAQEAERLDYASLWVGERLLRTHRHVPYGGNPPGPLPAYFQSIYDPLETLAYVPQKPSESCWEPVSSTPSFMYQWCWRAALRPWIN